jgi:hypothetical protein
MDQEDAYFEAINLRDEPEKVAELLLENERLRGALVEIAETLEADGRFPNAVPAIRAALEGRPE